jgi:hypothetical protein
MDNTPLEKQATGASVIGPHATPLASPTLSPQELLGIQGDGRIALAPTTRAPAEQPDVSVGSAAAALKLDAFNADKGLYRYRNQQVDMLVAFLGDNDRPAKPSDIIKSMVLGTMDVTNRPFPSTANKRDLQAAVRLIKDMFGSGGFTEARFDLDEVYARMQNPEKANEVINATGVYRSVVRPVVDLGSGAVMITRLNGDPRGETFPRILSFEVVVKK